LTGKSVAKTRFQRAGSKGATTTGGRVLALALPTAGAATAAAAAVPLSAINWRLLSVIVNPSFSAATVAIRAGAVPRN
jgi:hypothetical protein